MSCDPFNACNIAMESMTANDRLIPSRAQLTHGSASPRGGNLQFRSYGIDNAAGAGLIRKAPFACIREYWETAMARKLVDLPRRAREITALEVLARSSFKSPAVEAS